MSDEPGNATPRPSLDKPDAADQSMPGGPQRGERWLRASASGIALALTFTLLVWTIHHGVDEYDLLQTAISGIDDDIARFERNISTIQRAANADDAELASARERLKCLRGYDAEGEADACMEPSDEKPVQQSAENHVSRGRSGSATQSLSNTAATAEPQIEHLGDVTGAWSVDRADELFGIELPAVCEARPAYGFESKQPHLASLDALSDPQASAAAESSEGGGVRIDPETCECSTDEVPQGIVGRVRNWPRIPKDFVGMEFCDLLVPSCLQVRDQRKKFVEVLDKLSLNRAAMAKVADDLANAAKTGMEWRKEVEAKQRELMDAEERLKRGERDSRTRAHDLVDAKAARGRKQFLLEKARSFEPVLIVSHLAASLWLLLLLLHFSSRLMLSVGSNGKRVLPGHESVVVPGMRTEIAPATSNSIELPVTGTPFFYAAEFQTGSEYAHPLLPPRPGGSPIGRLVHGRYWLRRFAGDEAGERKLTLTGRNQAGWRFVRVRLERGQAAFIDIRTLAGFSGEEGGPHTRLGGLFNSACWLIGHPLPVVFEGPCTILLYVAFPLRVEPSSPPARASALVRQVVAIPAGSCFKLGTLVGQNSLASLLEGTLSGRREIRPASDGCLLIEDTQGRGSRIATTVLHLVLHLGGTAAILAVVLGSS